MNVQTSRLVLLSFVGLSSSFMACADEAASDPRIESSPPAGTVRARVTYDGERKEPLIVAPYRSCPPQGPPVDLKFVRVESPRFPAEVELPNLAPGRYHLLVYVGTSMQPAAADPQTCTADAVEVTSERGARVDVALP